MGKRIPNNLSTLESTDQGLVAIPYGFRVNGSSDPDDVTGDALVSVALAEAGEYVLTFRNKPVAVLGALPPNIENTADDVDLYAKIDPSDMIANGKATVRCMTGATQTTPTDNTFISGVIFVKKTDRVARGFNR
jgi:antitoxin (DNA-binding transcriptional repressor) of toxin-antitoxin stability system